MPICFSKITMSPPCHCSTSHGTFLPLYRTRIRMLFQCTSSNLRNKKRLRKNPEAFCSSRRLPIFTRRFQRTILGTSELNFCVRNGNRWNLTVIVTDQYDWFSITFLFYFVQCFYCNPAFKIVGNNSWIAFRNRCCFPRLSMLSCDEGRAFKTE